MNTVDFIRQKVEEKGPIDVGYGVEKELGISRDELEEAVQDLRMEGHGILYARVPSAIEPSIVKEFVGILLPKGVTVKDFIMSNVHSMFD